MSYEIAIPSYNRADVCKTKTLAMLRAQSIPAERITVFVASEDQRSLYEEVIPRDLYGRIVVAVLGHREVKNWISQYYPLGKQYVSIDDDIFNIVQLTGDGKLQTIVSLDELILDGFRQCEIYKFHLWGIAPVANGFFMRQTVHNDLKFCIGCFWGCINRQIPITLNLKDDYERSLQNAVRDGGVIRFSYVAAVTKYCATGGINQSKEQRAEANGKEVEYLLKSFPGLVRLNAKRPGEILLNRKIKPLK